MLNILSKVSSALIDLFKYDNRNYQQKQIERYLAASSDLVDLERRQRDLHRKFGF